MTATSTDGEPLFTNKQFPSLVGEDNTVNISLPLPTSEEYYITVSACNALGCGPPSSPLTISKPYYQQVYKNNMEEGGGMMVNVCGCFFGYNIVPTHF